MTFSQKRKIVGESTSTQVLRDLEISLRTNHIEWVKEFLDDDNQGLDALVDYLSFRLTMMRHEQRIEESRAESEADAADLQHGGRHHHYGDGAGTSAGGLNGTATSAGDASVCGGGAANHSTLSATSMRHMNGAAGLSSVAGGSGSGVGYLRPGLGELLATDSPNLKRRSRHVTKLNMGASTDDIHVCIMCLRAIMNNKYGFNMVIKHREAINCIALSLIHKSQRTKSLVLELLAAICLVKGGHEIILSSFDNFKEVCQEVRRFQTLMDYFINYDLFHLEFMVACMQFVNIIVHSVENMNYRVHLQYEFTALRLDEYLKKLRQTESDDLHVQINAYLDNVFDVAALMEDSETKTAALERVQDMEDDLSRTLDSLAEMERKLDEMHGDMSRMQSERDDLFAMKRQTEEEVLQLRRIVQQNELELMNRQNMLESKNQELQTLTRSLPKGAVAAKMAEYTAMMALSNGGGGEMGANGMPGANGGRGNNGAGFSDALGAPMIPPPPAPALLAAAAAPPPPPPPPMAPPPPPPPMMGGPNMPGSGPKFLGSFSAPPPPPPVAGSMPAPDGAMTIKRKVQTKYKLPTLNWIALKPNQVRDKHAPRDRFSIFDNPMRFLALLQVRGTIFNEIDDEKLHKFIDFTDFEERFKIGLGAQQNGLASEVDGCGLTTQPSKRSKKQENVSLLEHTRLRNIGEHWLDYWSSVSLHQSMFLNCLPLQQQSHAASWTCALRT